MTSPTIARQRSLDPVAGGERNGVRIALHLDPHERCGAGRDAVDLERDAANAHRLRRERLHPYLGGPHRERHLARDTRLELQRALGVAAHGRAGRHVDERDRHGAGAQAPKLEGAGLVGHDAAPQSLGVRDEEPCPKADRGVVRAVVGVAIGSRIRPRVSERVRRGFVLWLLSGIGVRLVLGGLGVV